MRFTNMTLGSEVLYQMNHYVGAMSSSAHYYCVPVQGMDPTKDAANERGSLRSFRGPEGQGDSVSSHRHSN